jgi:hypothetical protein
MGRKYYFYYKPAYFKSLLDFNARRPQHPSGVYYDADTPLFSSIRVIEEVYPSVGP